MSDFSSPLNKALPPLRRSPSGSGLSVGDGLSGELVVGSSGLRAVRTARVVNHQLEQIPPDRMSDVQRALAILQECGIHEVADVNGLHDAVSSRLAHDRSTNGTIDCDKNITLSPFLQAGLNFNFSQQEMLVDTFEVGRSLYGLKPIQTLKLSFNRCTNLNTLRDLGIGISQLSSLVDVDIDFSHCTSLMSLDGFGDGIERLTALQKLSLSFQGCTRLQTGAELGRGIAPLIGLHTLFLSFEGCPLLNTETAVSIGSVISKLPNLINLDLDVCGSKVRRGAKRPTILETGPLGITNYMIPSATAQ